jgi:hypothetical protein
MELIRLLENISIPLKILNISEFSEANLLQAIIIFLALLMSEVSHQSTAISSGYIGNKKKNIALIKRYINKSNIIIFLFKDIFCSIIIWQY